MWQSIQYTCIVGHGIPRRPILTDVLWGPLDYSSKKVENYPLGLRKTVSRFLKKIKIDLWMGVTGSLSFIEGKEKQFRV